MRPLSPQLEVLIATGQFWTADLYTITILMSGTVIRLTTADYDITSGAHVYTSSGPPIERSKIKQKIGASVDDLDITIYPRQTDLVDGIPFLWAIKQGAFDGAVLDIDRAFMPTAGDVSAGLIRRFSGRFGPIDGDETSVDVTIKSWAELLDIQWPKQLYSPSCILTLFEPACGVNRASYTFSGTIGAGCTLSALNITGIAQGDGYFDTGILALNGGLIRRSIKSWTGDTAKLNTPLFTLPNPGDTATLTAGCDKTAATCNSKFWGSNYTLHFMGQPFIPDPETAA